MTAVKVDYLGLPYSGVIDPVGVARRGLIELDSPVQLASGAWSRWFVDGKRALSHGSDLILIAGHMDRLMWDAGHRFDAVGGLTMGADHLAHAIAIVSSCDWFSVRKEPKGRGTDQLIEGAHIGHDVKVLLVDDVVTTGGSMIRAWHTITAAGAEVVAAVSFVDRGRRTAEWFEQRRVPYFPLVTFADLRIPEVR